MGINGAGRKPVKLRWTWLESRRAFAVMLDEPTKAADGTLNYGKAIRVNLTPEQAMGEPAAVIDATLRAVEAVLEVTGSAPPRPIPVIGEAT